MTKGHKYLNKIGLYRITTRNNKYFVFVHRTYSHLYHCQCPVFFSSRYEWMHYRAFGLIDCIYIYGGKGMCQMVKHYHFNERHDKAGILIYQIISKYELTNER